MTGDNFWLWSSKLSFADVKPLCLWRISCRCSDNLGKNNNRYSLSLVCSSDSFFSGAMLNLPLVNGFAMKRNPPFLNISFFFLVCVILFWQKRLYIALRVFCDANASMVLSLSFLIATLFFGLLPYSCVNWIDFYDIAFFPRISVNKSVVCPKPVDLTGILCLRVLKHKLKYTSCVPMY